MGAKSKRKKAGKSRRGRGGRKRAVAKINCGGLKIEAPPELDLPAGAPFATGPQQERAPSIPGDVQALLKPLAAIATNAWRAKTKMTDAETGEPLEEMRRVYRFVEGVFAALEDAGVQVLDPTGRTYDSGLALKVLNFESTPGLCREEIVQTIRPSIIWQDRLLQMGEVIVGTPETAEKDDMGPGATTGDSPQTRAGENTVLDETPVIEANDGKCLVSDSCDTRNARPEGEDNEQNND